MYEFHGWANIVGFDEDLVDFAFKKTERVVAELKGKIESINDDGSIYELRSSSNNIKILITNGLRNHRNDDALNLFQWIADNEPNSYGILHIWDDEDEQDYDKCVVWKLLKGRLKKSYETEFNNCSND